MAIDKWTDCATDTRGDASIVKFISTCVGADQSVRVELKLLQNIDLHRSKCIGLNVETGVITGEAVTREIIQEKKIRDSIVVKDVILARTTCQGDLQQSGRGL